MVYGLSVAAQVSTDEGLSSFSREVFVIDVSIFFNSKQSALIELYCCSVIYFVRNNNSNQYRDSLHSFDEI